MDGIEYRSPVDDYLFCYMMIAGDGRMRLKGREEGGDVSVVGLRFTRLTLNASSFSNDWMHTHVPWMQWAIEQMSMSDGKRKI